MLQRINNVRFSCIQGASTGRVIVVLGKVTIDSGKSWVGGGNGDTSLTEAAIESAYSPKIKVSAEYVFEVGKAVETTSSEGETFKTVGEGEQQSALHIVAPFSISLQRVI